MNGGFTQSQRRLPVLIAVVLATAVLGTSALLTLNPHAFPKPLLGILGAEAATPTEAAPAPSPVQLSSDTMSYARPEFRWAGSQPWQIRSRPHGSVVLEGYASRPSYLPGDVLRLAVNTSAPRFDLTIWLVSGKAPVAGPFVQVAQLRNLRGMRQGRPYVDPVTKLVAAQWRFGVSYTIPRTWSSGIYLVRLDSSQGVQSYIPFVVRSPKAHAVLVVSSAMDWQAYNRWGGSSVYWTNVGEPAVGVTRAYGVSFDRPYLGNGGAGQLFFLELPFVSWILRQNLDVAFTTDYDLSVDPAAQPLPRVVVFNGHDEYWGVKLFEWLDHHVNQVGDMGLAMLAADTGFWPVEFAHPTVDGPRDMIVYKTGPLPSPVAAGGRAGATPAPGVSASPALPTSAVPTSAVPSPAVPTSAVPSPAPGATSSDAADETAGTIPILWDLPRSGPYLGAFAAQRISGVTYNGIATVLGRYTLSADALQSGLLYGSGLQAGASLGFIAGGEVDAVVNDARYWGPLAGRFDHEFASSVAIPGRGYVVTANAVWRNLPSGGRVFSSGTFYWGWALDPAWGSEHRVPSGFGRLTRNILHWLGRF